MLRKNNKEDIELLQAIIRGDKTAPERQPVQRIEEEHQIQVSCVRWFRMQYSRYARLLYAVPNGGARSKTTAAKLKAEGVVAGVADLVLAIPRGGYGALYIEMKQKGNYQQKNQKEWQQDCESVGNRYVVCKNITEFMREVNGYMAQEPIRALKEEIAALKDKLRRLGYATD